MPKKILLTILLALASALPASGADVTAEQVQQALEKGVGYLRRANVFNNRAQMGIGQNALAILAAIHSGVPADDPDLVRAADMCANPQNWMANTYHVGCVAAALAAVDPGKYRATLMKCADYLIEGQNADGGWRYTNAMRYQPAEAQAHKQWLDAAMTKIEMWRERPKFANPAAQMSDHSCTQYGLLGLRACEDSGIYIPQATWKLAESYLVKTQGTTGGWGYTTENRAYGSMTAAGLGSLYIVGSKLHQRAIKCGEYEQNKAVAAGLDWLSKNYSVTTNPGNGNYYGYYMYGLERCFSFSGRHRIGGHDWYAEGANHLVPRQNPDGSWAGGGFGGQGGLDTIFFLLFLGKASANVMIQKLEYGDKWNTDMYDAERLAQRTSKELGLKATWQVVGVDETVESMLEAPILYVSGHGEIKFTDAQREKLRQFCERGGTIIADACCSDKLFDAAFREEMKKMFPDSSLEKLTEEHPVYLRPHKITEEKNLVWEGVTFGCRVAVLYSQKDLSCPWDGNVHDKEVSLDETSALRIGVNAAAYAMGYRPLKDKLDKLEDAEKVPQEKDDGRVARGALIFAQLKHDGDSNPDPGAAGAMMHYYSKATGARVSVTRVEISPLDPDMEKYPYIYITGHNEFKYDEKEVTALREYFERGGFMFADACCGKKKFDKSFRELVAQIFPNHPLQRLPLDHKLFDMKYKIKTVEYKPTLLAELAEGEKDKPHLEGIVVDGRVILVYSPYDLGCSFESFPHPGARAVVRDSAEKLLANILVYGMTE